MRILILLLLAGCASPAADWSVEENVQPTWIAPGEALQFQENLVLHQEHCPWSLALFNATGLVTFILAAPVDYQTRLVEPPFIVVPFACADVYAHGNGTIVQALEPAQLDVQLQLPSGHQEVRAKIDVGAEWAYFDPVDQIVAGELVQYESHQPVGGEHYLSRSYDGLHGYFSEQREPTAVPGTHVLQWIREIPLGEADIQVTLHGYKWADWGIGNAVWEMPDALARY